MKTSGGKTLIRVKSCGVSPRVTAVYLAPARDVHDVLWRIESPSGSDVDSYVLSETPPGFDQVVALRQTLTPGVQYYVNASQPSDHPLGLPGLVFNPSQLSDDRWLVSHGKMLTDDELERYDPC